MLQEKQMNELINQVSRLADNVEELTTTIDSNLNTGMFYDGKLVDGLMSISEAINPDMWKKPIKKSA